MKKGWIGARVRIRRPLGEAGLGDEGVIVDKASAFDWYVKLEVAAKPYYLFNDHELEVIDVKKLKMETVNCQTEALMALLKELGHEIEEPKPVGKRVRVGQTIYDRSQNKWTVAPKQHGPDNISVYMPSGEVTFFYFKNVLTLHGEPVIGYAE